jgi:hypothetical protein
LLKQLQQLEKNRTLEKSQTNFSAFLPLRTSPEVVTTPDVKRESKYQTVAFRDIQHEELGKLLDFTPLSEEKSKGIIQKEEEEEKLDDLFDFLTPKQQSEEEEDDSEEEKQEELHKYQLKRRTFPTELKIFDQDSEMEGSKAEFKIVGTLSSRQNPIY